MSEVSTNHRYEKALKLVERLIEIAPDPGFRIRAERLQHHLKLPMTDIIAKVPGDSIIQKAKTLGVTRQALYGWLDGLCRPSPKQARKIAKLTGLDAADVRGFPDV
jgi:hypothetical protein